MAKVVSWPKHDTGVKPPFRDTRIRSGETRGNVNAKSIKTPENSCPDILECLKKIFMM